MDEWQKMIAGAAVGVALYYLSQIVRTLNAILVVLRSDPAKIRRAWGDE